MREAGEGSVPGVLLDLGAYPGWVAGEGAVAGEVFRVEPRAEALAVLDELEEHFGPATPATSTSAWR